MTPEEISKFAEWLERQITNSKLSQDEYRDDPDMESYFQGRLSAFTDAYKAFQE